MPDAVIDEEHGPRNLMEAVQVHTAKGLDHLGNTRDIAVTGEGTVRITEGTFASFDHGSNRDIGTAIEQFVAPRNYAFKKGILLKAAVTNAGIIYVGNNDVTAGTTGATDGFPLSGGDSVFIEVSDPSELYVIASVATQVLYWLGV